MNFSKVVNEEMNEKSNEKMNETKEKINETDAEKNNKKENGKKSDTMFSMKKDDDEEDKIELKIDVFDVPFWPTFYKKHKKKIIILIAIISCIFVAGITALIVLLLKRDSNKEKWSDSFSPYPIPDDYFIKATYISEAGENVRLISDIYNLNKIKELTIDGKTVEPTKNYDFNEGGEHIIYYSFNNYNSDSSLSEGGWIFSGIENLKYVEFSNNTKIYPDVRFKGMFNNCKNIMSVDLSQIKIYYNFFSYSYYLYNQSHNNYSYEYFEYLNSMEYMFNNCINLKSLNFDFKINDYDDDCIYVTDQKFMFNNCKSLTYISISSLCFSCYECSSFELNNMFYNCFSLKTVIFNEYGGFSGYSNSSITNMSYMFYNCTSLVSLSLPSEYMKMPYDMSYIFANCSSLKNLDLDFSSYYYEPGKSMSNAFRDCYSLVTINFNFVLDYEDMSYAFMNCLSLRNIDIYFLNPFNVRYMNNMFYNCYSLNSIDFLSSPIIFYELIDISYMLSGCYNLQIANFSILMTDKINNYQGLFYHCHNLKIIDISSFTHNNLPNSNLSIFYDNYCYDCWDNFTIFINKEFLKRIKIPDYYNIIIKNKTYIY